MTAVRLGEGLAAPTQRIAAKMYKKGKMLEVDRCKFSVEGIAGSDGQTATLPYSSHVLRCSTPVHTSSTPYSHVVSHEKEYTYLSYSVDAYIISFGLRGVCSVLRTVLYVDVLR